MNLVETLRNKTSSKSSRIDFIRDHYDNEYSENYDDIRNIPAYSRLMDRCIDSLNPASGESYLFLGIGTGNEVLELLERGVEPSKITGVDISRNMLDIASSKIEDLEAIVCDITNLSSIESNSYQNVICIHAFDQVEDMQEATSEAIRVLEPNGKYLFTYPNGASFLSLIMESLPDIAGYLFTGKFEELSKGISAARTIIKSSEPISPIREENASYVKDCISFLEDNSSVIRITKGYGKQDIIVYGRKGESSGN
jgi:ubiquinone/menaquinone biosynthesis C-methylase UbiE